MCGLRPIDTPGDDDHDTAHDDHHTRHDHHTGHDYRADYDGTSGSAAAWQRAVFGGETAIR